MPRNAVSIKGTRNGLVITFDVASEFEEIKKNLRAKIESAGNFLKGARLSFSHDDHIITDRQKSELSEICRQYGLTLNTEAKLPKNIMQYRQCSMAGASPAIERERTWLSGQKYSRAGTSLTEGETALLVKRNLRSGQQVVFHKHVVVLGDVHPGAEIVAEGNILVMGCCRGSVHAGARGDQTAYVIACRLLPENLRIANILSRQKILSSPRPLMARMVNKNIVFKPLNKL